MDEIIQKFKSKKLVKPKISAVYGIYTLSGECLWIGQTENLYSQLDDHYHSSRASTIRGHVENDDGSDISIDDLWEKTALKTIVVKDTRKRNELEKRLIEELEPRYNKQRNVSTNQKDSVKSASSLMKSLQTSEDNLRYDIPDKFQTFVLSWDWPDPPSQGTKQAQNIVGVIYRLMSMNGFTTDDFITAIQNRADEARGMKPSLGDDYEETVRANCVRDLGYNRMNKTRSTAAEDFLAESRKVVKEYKSKYRYQEE